MKKKIISLVAFLSFSLALLASNDKGIELYKAGMFDAALDVFAQQTNQTSEEQAITAYYKGLIYASEQNLEAAGAEFQKAIDLAPKLAYGYIGKGRLALKNDVKAGETVLKQAEGLGKKNADVLVKVAEAYFANNMTTKALPLIAKAKAADKKNADIYLLEGDMALVPTMSSETIGKAINRYEDAEFFSDNTNKIALLKLAQMYRMTGIYNIALEKVNQAIALDKDFLPIYVELANIQYAQSKFTESVASYEKVLNTGVKVPFEWYENYAFALYFDKQYEKSLQEIEKNLVQKPSNPTLLRLRAYNLYELGRNEEALVQMGKFFETVPQDKQIYLDFIIMGRIQVKVAREEIAKKENADAEKANILFASAIESFNKALAFEDAKAIEAYKELASTYVSMKNYELAIQNFEKFMEGTPKPTLVDFNAFGQMATDAAIAIYLANQKDVKALQANQQLFNSIVEKGAKAYSDLITLVPHLQAGYTGRAYIYSLVDAYESDMTEKHGGVAKPYYDEALAFYLQNNTNGKFNKNIIDAYLYYAGYYIKNNDTKNAVENYRKVLAIDPTNESALKTLKLLNVKP